MQNGLFRDVLNRFHQTGKKLPVGTFTGRKRHTAVAQEHGSNSMPGYRGYLGDPANLRILVGVKID